MKILVTGSTGTAGGDLIREAAKDSDIVSIKAISRKPLSFSHPKLQTVLHNDYLNYTPIEQEFIDTDWLIWCLGISQSQVSKDEYVKITYDYTIAAAKTLKRVNPHAGFIFVSGAGADENGKASTLFGKIKGKAERELLDMGFERLYIVRPGGIKPININPNTARVNKIMAPLYPLLELLVPFTVIRSDDLGKAMINLAKKGYNHPIVNNKELRVLSRIN